MQRVRLWAEHGDDILQQDHDSQDSSTKEDIRVLVDKAGTEESMEEGGRWSLISCLITTIFVLPC